MSTPATTRTRRARFAIECQGCEVTIPASDALAESIAITTHEEGLGGPTESGPLPATLAWFRPAPLDAEAERQFFDAHAGCDLRMHHLDLGLTAVFTPRTTTD